MDSPKPSPRSSLRLQHFLALGGVGSRRACEALIAAGRVTVDGVVVRRQGICVAPDTCRIELDGRVVCTESKICLLLNKPRGIVCTASDPQGRQTFMNLLPASLGQRVYTVGRLDRDSEGLLVVTNDGFLADGLMHPRHNVEKTYLVWPRRLLTPSEEQRLRQGVQSKGERLALDELARTDNIYRVRLQEGRNRHIRRMFAAVGADVLRLKRIAVGSLKLGSLRSGGWRYLEDREVEELRKYIRERSCIANRGGGSHEIKQLVGSGDNVGYAGGLDGRCGADKD